MVPLSKKLFLSLLLLSPFHSLSGTVYFPQGITAANIQQTQDLQIAWDIHGVLAKKDPSAKASAIIANIFAIGWSKIAGNKAWDEISKLPKDADLSGEAYVTIFLKHGEAKLAQFAEKAANAYKPRKGMEEIVYEIDIRGIPQRLASNIGPRCFANLDAKFKSKKYNCTVFDVIKPGKIIDFSVYSNEPLSYLPAHLTRFGKPLSEFFEEFTALYGHGKNSYIIFIDDKIENIYTAVAHGWIGIYFDTNAKDPVAQLRADLITLGMLN